MVDIYKNNLKLVKDAVMYLGGEYNQIIKNASSVKCNVSYINLKEYKEAISDFDYLNVYSKLNAKEDVWCKRQSMPSLEFEKYLRKEKLELYSVEDKEPIKNSDVISIKLKNVLDYTNLINVLELSGIRIFTENKKNTNQLIIAEIPSEEENNIQILSQFVDIVIVSNNINISETYEKLIDKYCVYKKKNNKDNINTANINEYFNMIMDMSGVYVSDIDNVIKNDNLIENKNFECYLKKQLVSNLDVRNNAILLDLSNIQNYNTKLFFENIKKIAYDTGISKININKIHGENLNKNSLNIKENLLELLENNNFLLTTNIIDILDIDIDFLKYIDRFETLNIYINDNEFKNKKIKFNILNNIKKVLDFNIYNITFNLKIDITNTTYIDIEKISEFIEKIKKEYKEYEFDFEKFNLNIEFYEEDILKTSYIENETNIYDLSKIEKNKIKIKYLKEKLDNIKKEYIVDNEKRIKVKSVLLSGNKDMYKMVYMAFKNGAKNDNTINLFKSEPWEKSIIKKERM